ncbi:hypothetical protein [Acinetobacter rathckeae]|uniref:hypothetical protein n=1 Tax=Acinetobacter rathckeae TaxID=2605272 RepID=UPI0018A2FEC8|nr:hypothetical protein [Acinetobacter rathckeae]MBF7687852.1 hypothetical protein [Acinetobacter rathckeae]MBF7687925.1 hypothetical protein [Acinetobacter rathckeae]MBF7696022.1 hypothetical protein [Acinetobacter rathckeae]
MNNHTAFTPKQTEIQYADEIEALQDIVQHGVGVQRTDNSFDFIIDTFLGRLPYGVDSSQFSTRKRFVLIQQRISTIGSVIMMFSCSLLTIIMTAVAISNFWYMGFVALLFVFLVYYSFKTFKKSLALYNAIKNLQQTVPDIEKTHTVVNEAEIAQMFAQDRLKSRMIGAVLIAVCSYLCYTIYYGTIHKVWIFSLIAPCGFILGIGSLITGMNKPEILYRHGYAQARWKDLPLVMKVCMFLGVLASVLTWAWIKGFLAL